MLLQPRLLTPITVIPPRAPHDADNRIVHDSNAVDRRFRGCDCETDSVYNCSMKSLFVALALSLVVPAASAYKVIGISDGDTLTLLVDGRPLKIRLANIDAPENKQAFGERSKRSLSRLCFGKDAYFQAQDTDRHGRTVAVVNCGGVEANRAQVEGGMAWVYRKYNNDLPLLFVEARAKEKRRGLWSRKSPTPPWEFGLRKGTKTFF
jgi:micrococcal nuclease